MIINLVGAPCAGKSTFAARFVLEHPEFKYCPIDEYRIKYEDEVLAWEKLTQDIIENKDVIVESCGMSWQLAQTFNTGVIRSRKIYTIAFHGNQHQLEERLEYRQKRSVPMPFKYDPNDERMAIRWTLEHLAEKAVVPIDVWFDTTITDPPQVARILTKRINRERLKELTNPALRKRKVLKHRPPYLRREQKNVSW